MRSSDIHRVHLVINPQSGYGGQRLMVGDLHSELRRAGLEVVEYTTVGPGDGRRYASTIHGPGEAVLVWGGDGTVNEVANGLAGANVPILACPAGTENLLAKELRVPGDPAAIVRLLRTGRVADFDVGVINGKNFLLIIGIGFDGEVVRRLAAVRTGHISHLTYFWPIWRTFWEHYFPKMTIVADGQKVFDGYGMAFVGNISRYAVGLRICRDARYDDGMLDLVVFRCREQAGLMLHAAWTLLRMHPLRGDVVYRRCRDIRIETDPATPCQVDGDAGPNTPVDISLAPWRIKLIVPVPQRPGWKFWPWVTEP